jgi:hypothetical protein
MPFSLHQHIEFVMPVSGLPLLTPNEDESFRGKHPYLNVLCSTNPVETEDIV